MSRIILLVWLYNVSGTFSVQWDLMDLDVGQVLPKIMKGQEATVITKG